MKIKWHEEAWKEYLESQYKDKKALRRINDLVKDIQRNGNSGIGKLEPLIDNKTGWWSRRIDEKNRIVYKIIKDELIIASCKGHYDDK